MPEAKRLLTRADVYRMDELGMLGDERVELLWGELVEKPRMNPPHAFTVVRLTRVLARALPEPFELRPTLLGEVAIAVDDLLPPV